ncbi:MAG TPA: LCP family protein [Anaerolineales bacterium]|nr:LCP family protein [Anaerolineales bacterium]
MMNVLAYDDPYSDTRPNRTGWPLDETQSGQPAIGYAPRPPAAHPRRRRRRRIPTGCLSVLLATLILVGIYFLLPIRTNLLILGTDSRDPTNPLGRTDTMILTTVVPLAPEIGMLSVPRDLWVIIPRYGENRINTAYFFAEAENPGTGAGHAIETVNAVFGVNMDYYLLINFAGIVNIVDAMGGIDVDFPREMSGYEAGVHHLDGTQALALVRDRTGDDFLRLERGQVFIRSAVREFMNPLILPRLPAIVLALSTTMDTDLPVWQWPRIGLAVLRAGPEGIESRTITREMATGFFTADGANVLLPHWDLIHPVVDELFR